MAPKIYTSPYPSMPLVKTSIFHYSFPTPTCESAKLPHARLSPDLPAFVDAATGRVVSRRQLKSDALRLSLGLRTNQELGLNKGDVIMLFSVNSIDYPSVLYGGQAGGFITTLANSGYTPQEVKHQLEDSGAKVVFVHPSLLPVLSGTIDLLKQKSKPIPKVYFLARETDLPAEAGNTGIQSYENLMVDEEKVKQANWVGEKVEGNAVHQTAVLCYSSGTTGLSKGVESTHYNLTSVQTMLTHPGPYPSLSPENNDKIVGVLPFYHIFGLAKLLLHPLSQGVPVITHARFEPEAFLRSIHEHKITWALVVPPILVVMASSPLVDKYDLSSLKGCVSGAAPLGDGLTRKVLARMHPSFRITQGYGLTESSPTLHYMPLHLASEHIGSVGPLCPHVEARLVDIDGNDVPEGQPGELWVRGPNIMKGYWKNPEATRNTFQDEWFKTGDIAQRDKDGFYYIVDRLKELIKYKGFQVPPADLEALLLTHHKIADAGVCGVHSEEQATELPRAYIVPIGGLDSLKTEDDRRRFAKEVKDWVAKQVANHKQLRGGVILIEAIPKSAAGKILRRELRSRAAKEFFEEEKAAKRQAKL